MNTLTEREEEILCEVVRLYLGKGEPVPSGAVARNSRTGLSPASIRAVMSMLEERGFLDQPHTSAGRVPSDSGLSRVLPSLLPGSGLSEGEKLRLRGLLSKGGTVEERLERVSRVLAQVTLQVGMAATQTSPQTELGSIHFVGISAERVLAVLVTRGGLIESRMLRVDRAYDADELERISNYCTEQFAGRSLVEIRERLRELMAEERAQYDSILRGVVALREWADVTDLTLGGAVYFQGVERLLDDVGRRRIAALQRLLAALSDKAALLRLLDSYLSGSGPRVVLPSELQLGDGGEIGMIMSTFELASGESGVVGIIGLRYMNYPHLLPVVDFLGRCLAGSGGEEGDRQ